MSELNIPESWAEVKIGDVSKEQTLGLVRSAIMQSEDHPYPYVKMGDITMDGRLLIEQLISVDASDEELERFRIEEGDFLFNTRNSQKLVGKSCCVGKLLNQNTLFNNNILRARFFEGLSSNYVSYMFKTREIQHELTLRNRGTTNVSAIYAKDFNTIRLPLPPLKEQERIVHKIETCFGKIESAEQNLNKAEILLSKYRESLLAKAFRGELIPQDANDEPASVLLEKIREEREKNQTGKKKQEFAPISDDEKPFDIPDSWEWVRLGELIGNVNQDKPSNNFNYIDIDSVDNRLFEVTNPK